MGKQAKELSWEAVQKGKLRCAPACGAGCTQVQYEAAVIAGHELAEQLGDDWNVRVWENLGWHYSAVHKDGYWKVHANRDYHRGGAIYSYTAFLGDEHAGGRWAEQAKTPEAAIKKVQTLALKDVREQAKWLGMKLS